MMPSCELKSDTRHVPPGCEITVRRVTCHLHLATCHVRRVTLVWKRPYKYGLFQRLWQKQCSRNDKRFVPLPLNSLSWQHEAGSCCVIHISVIISHSLRVGDKKYLNCILFPCRRKCISRERVITAYKNKLWAMFVKTARTDYSDLIRRMSKAVYWQPRATPCTELWIWEWWSWW